MRAHNKRAFFCNSGAEANEAAIKLTRKHAHEKLGIDFPIIITAKASFHGRTLAAITATGQPKYVFVGLGARVWLVDVCGIAL